jgi:hypothetical protein
LEQNRKVERLAAFSQAHQYLDKVEQQEYFHNSFPEKPKINMKLMMMRMKILLLEIQRMLMIQIWIIVETLAHQ